jgi:cytochrome c-type biogenesis protein CcmH
VEARLKSIAHELRCLVCQNQTIADSDAPLAVDLRQQVRGMIREGKSDEEIRGYMTDRYGDFVLYKPPFNAVTAVLWVGPALLIVGGFSALFVMLRRRRQAAEGAPSPDAARRREIEALLASDEDAKPKA